jgi:hypothetical protein
MGHAPCVIYSTQGTTLFTNSSLPLSCHLVLSLAQGYCSHVVLVSLYRHPRSIQGIDLVAFLYE